MARPKLPGSVRKAVYIRVRVTEDQMERYERAAKLAQQENEDIVFSDWVRQALNGAAEVQETKAGKSKGRKG